MSMLNTINALSSYTIDSKLTKDKTIKSTETNDTLFEATLGAAKGLLQATNEAEHVTAQLTNDFITGKNEDIHSLMIAQEKSSILLNFTLQTRNQVLTAYQEIMRIPV